MKPFTPINEGCPAAQPGGGRRRARARAVWLGAGLFLLAVFAAARVCEMRRALTIPILMYHHVGYSETSVWSVTAEDFERQLRCLREQGYAAILPADLVANRRWGRRLPRRPVIITFDDGYLDSLTIAEPLLARNGMRGIVYLITDFVAAGPSQRRRFEGADCLTWPEVRAMRRRGTLAFGGHSHNHINLAAAADPFAQTRECYLQIKNNAGFKPDSFCYPYGQYNERAAAAVRRAGFSTAMACKDAPAAIGPGTDLFGLPRVSVMGGRRRFAVERAAEKETPGELVARVAHWGVPLTVAPRLLGAPGAGWLAERDLGNGVEVEWRWRAQAAPDADLSLEIWDRHRVLRLYP